MTEYTTTLPEPRLQPTETGGRLRPEGWCKGIGAWVYDPHYRQRVDHYGNDGEGWDEDGWEADYARPLTDEVQAQLPEGYVVEVGDKGHVYVSPPTP